MTPSPQPKNHPELAGPQASLFHFARKGYHCSAQQCDAMKQTLSPSYLIRGLRPASTLLFFIAWLCPSGNLFAQNEADTLKSEIFYKDPATGELKPLAGEINTDWDLYYTLPRFNNRIINFGFSLAFPLRDFHASDPANARSGYAAQGYSVSTGLFLGFSEGSEAGWYFGAAYSGFRKSMDFVDSLNAVMPVITANQGTPNESQERLVVDPDYQPRYDIFSLQSGLAFEGSDERVAAYGSLMININLTRVNRFDLLNPALDEPEMRAPWGLSTGFSATFGLRFQQQLSLGLAFHYIGAPTLRFNEVKLHREQGLLDDVFAAFPSDRHIHFLEVKMGYSFIKRGGWRASRAKALN